jgi:hypothetical protein
MHAFVVESQHCAVDVIAALSVLGRQWRESKQPPIVRTVGGLGLHVRIDGRYFYLCVRGGPRRTVPACVGRVLDTPHGSFVEASFIPSRASAIAGLVGFLWAAAMPWFVIGPHFLNLLPGVGFLGMVAIAWSSTKRERGELQDLVSEIARHPSRSTETPQRAAT